MSALGFQHNLQEDFFNRLYDYVQSTLSTTMYYQSM